MVNLSVGGDSIAQVNRLEFVFTDLLICSREPLMNQQLWPCGHTLPGHPQFQQNEFQPRCRYSSSAPHSPPSSYFAHGRLLVLAIGRTCTLSFLLRGGVPNQPGAKRHPGQDATISDSCSLRQPLVGSIVMQADRLPLAIKTPYRTASIGGVLHHRSSLESQ